MKTSHLHRAVAPTPSEQLLLTSLRHQDVRDDADSMAELFARVAWSRLTEPGDRIAWILIERLGAPAALAHLIAGSSVQTILLDVHGSVTPAEESVVLKRSELERAIARWSPRLDREETVQDLQAAKQSGMKILIPQDTHWPVQVDDLERHAPLILWVRGNSELLTTPSLAIVGARSCTSYGQQITGEFAHAAVDRSLTVVSGAAYGIDGVAHRSVLAANGKTIAVVAGGADRVYPMEHDQLLRNIVDYGAVVSEVIPGTPPTRWRFLQRNRIIAALTQATLITEAGVKSGSINTAGHAAEIGRGLGAVPGPITSSSAHGCFRIIEEYGATMITRISDLDTLLGMSTTARDEAVEERQTSLHRRTLDALPRRGRRTAEEVARRAGLTAGETTLALIELELLGSVRKTGDDLPGDETWALVHTQ